MAIDKRGVEDFVSCEAHEGVRSLRYELQVIAEGKGQENVLDSIVGLKRKARHGTYQDWAKLMLLWISSARP
ncbi:MAG: hypothetical protein H6619_00885 [Deltaproteobacteria bacterium]|nr:hypothetical protein [Deltaproteobacteria bacterium]